MILKIYSIASEAHGRAGKLIPCESLDKATDRVQFSTLAPNFYNMKDETKKKISEKLKLYFSENPQELTEARIRAIEKSIPKMTARRIEQVFESDFESLPFESKRLRVVLEQNCKCLKCRLSHWFGELITYELDHIDGDNDNNKRDNLRILCPNCHSQTETWRGRKTKIRKKRIDKYAIFFEEHQKFNSLP